MLASGPVADAFDEYLHNSEFSTVIFTKEFCKKFFKEVWRGISPRAHLSGSSNDNQDRQRARFPGVAPREAATQCVGSIYFQHWEWKKCPIVWAVQFKRKQKKPTIVL